MRLDDLFLDKERCTYQINLFKDVKRIDKIGRITTSLQKIEDKIEIINETEMFTQKLKEKTTTQISRIDLSPLTYESRVYTPSVDVVVIGEYQRNKVEVRAILPQETKHFKMDLPNNFYDNATAFYVFRAFAFGALEKGQFTLVNLSVRQKILVELEISGEEEVSCDIGRFKCHGVKMKLCDCPQLPPQKFLYNQKSPYYLIKNVVGPQIIEIEKIRG